MHDGEEATVPTKVLVLMVRHGQRIDETVDAQKWLQENKDRWFDPPLTAEGKDQASAAAEQLKDFFDLRPDLVPLTHIYCSPLKRALQTAEQFGRVLNLPLLPVAGCASCTAAFKKHGPAGQPLISQTEATELCTATPVLGYDTQYSCMHEDRMTDFKLTIDRIATQESRKQVLHSASASIGAGASSTPVAVVVCHREGLRDTSQFTPTPFRSTPYCCIAAFAYSTGGVEVVAAPDDFDRYANTCRKGKPVFDWNAEGEEATDDGAVADWDGEVT